MKYPLGLGSGLFVCFLTIFLVFNSEETRTLPYPKENRFTPIFDGKTLKGWEGDPMYWRVENGSLVGEVTPGTLLKQNSFIIWKGGTVGDFELKLEYKISREGNSGINYRSESVKGTRYALRGYQLDLDGAKRFTGSNYEERRRKTLASQGEVVSLKSIEPAGAKYNIKDHIKNNHWIPSNVIKSLGNMDSLKAIINIDDWNDIHLIAKGNHLQHYVNGVLMSEVTDNDFDNRRLKGLLGVQVHKGPPMKVEYRNIQLKRLKK